jgi:general secretion pathway protein D
MHPFKPLLVCLLSTAAIVALGGEPLAQTKRRGSPRGRVAAAPSVAASASAAPSASASAAPGAPAGPGAPAPGAKPGKKRVQADTTDLKQFEGGVEYEPRNPNYRVAFSLEDADLAELVRVVGQLTGKRFIFGGKIRNIKATVFSPQKISVAEAYQAFLSILETNGLTVIPHGRFLKIVETPGVATQNTPIYSPGQTTPTESRFVTRLHRLSHVTAEEIATVLGKFKSKDADITVYGPGNLLIITDTGTNIRRLMQLVHDIDVGGAGDQIWLEPVHYMAATDIAARLNDVFELKGAAKAGSIGSDLHIAKIIADDRTNSLIIIATERAYLRILEFVKRIDVPHTGEGEIHVLPLQHAEAIDLAKTLNDIISGATQVGQTAAKPGGAVALGSIFESGIKVSADKATNSLVITSSLRDYGALRAVIDRLDQPRRQVFIEAVIMDLSITRQDQLGVAFHAGDVQTSPVGTGQSILYGGLNPFRSIGVPTPADTTLSAFALGVRGPGLPGSENLLGTGFSIPAFGILINALAGSSDADVLATPHILATDNEDAEISVGQNIPLQQNSTSFAMPQTGTTGAASALGALGGLGTLGMGSVPRQDIGTKIKIKPHLNDSDEVRLDVSEEISDVLGEQAQGSLGVVPYAKRTANTKLVVKDQQTVVIGGLVRNRVVRGQTKIPLLGDIPVLGALFRSSSSKMEKTNLILMLTPYIIRDQNDLRTVFERKMQERQEFLDHYFVFSDNPEYQPPKDYSRTSGLVDEIRRAYLAVEERRHLDVLSVPRTLRTHEPGQPIELPAAVRGGVPGAPASPASPASPGVAPSNPSPPPIHVTPPARNIERIER